MIRLRRNSRRHDAQRSNLPWRPILLLVLAIVGMEVVNVLTLEESIYAQDAPVLPPTTLPAPANSEAVVHRTALSGDSVDSSVVIVDIYGPNSVRAGELVNYRVRLADGTKRPVIYRWNMGDGTQAEGNNVPHRWERPGRYKIVATVQNRFGTDTKTMDVVVSGNVVIPVPEFEEIASGDRARETATENVAKASATEPAPYSARDAAFRGPRPLSWSDAGYTLLVSTSSDRAVAERTAVDLRRRGLRSGIYLDDTGIGSPIFRVVVGNFDDEGAAVRGRQVLLAEGYSGAFIVHPMPQR